MFILSRNPLPPQPVPMLGAGFYNRNARLQAADGALALPLIDRAIADMPEPGTSFTIADYGAAQGRNSMQPVHRALAALRDRWGASLPVSVVHADQPANDFTSLFALLQDGDESYLTGDRQVFPAAIGRSFYEQVLPDGSVDFGWASFSAHWLSRAPVAEAGHLWARMTAPATRLHFSCQAARDWHSFLTLRARELRRGGHLLVVQPCIGESQTSAFPEMMQVAQAALNGALRDGVLRPAEAARMTVLQYERQVSEIREPFLGGNFLELGVVTDVVDDLPDQPWAEFLAHGDAAKLAEQYIRFFEAPFLPPLLAALDADRDAAFRAALTTLLEESLRRAVLFRPASWLSPLMVSALLLRKP
jgi:hypothetical protein